MKKALIVILLLAPSVLNAQLQLIKIGMKSEEVKEIVEFSVKSSNKGVSLDKRTDFETVYNNGSVEKIILHIPKVNQLHTDENPNIIKQTDIMMIYQIENGELNSIVTVYEALSKQEVSQLTSYYHHPLPIKRVTCYLNDNLIGFTQIFMNDINLPCSMYFENIDFFTYSEKEKIKLVKSKVIAENKQYELLQEQQRIEAEKNKYQDVDTGVVNLSFTIPYFIRKKIRGNFFTFADNEVLKSNPYRDGNHPYFQHLSQSLQGVNFITDSCLVDFRIEKKDNGGVSRKHQLYYGREDLYQLFNSATFKFGDAIPTPNEGQVNFLDVDSIKIASTVGLYYFKTYTDRKTKERYVVKASEVPDLTISEDVYRQLDYKPNLTGLASLSAILDDVTLQNEIIKDKKTYVMFYQIVKVNGKTFIFNSVK